MSRRETVGVINTSPVPQELTGGRILGPGEVAEDVTLDKHLRERIGSGQLTSLDASTDSGEDEPERVDDVPPGAEVKEGAK